MRRPVPPVAGLLRSRGAAPPARPQVTRPRDPYETVRALLDPVATGGLHADDAVERVAVEPVGSPVCAWVDLRRAVPTGVPEVICGEGTSAEQIGGILGAVLDHGRAGLTTCIDGAKADHVGAALPQAGHRWQARARIIESRPRAWLRLAGVCGMPDPQGREAGRRGWQRPGRGGGARSWWRRATQAPRAS